MNISMTVLLSGKHLAFFPSEHSKICVIFKSYSNELRLGKVSEHAHCISNVPVTYN